MGHKKSYEWIIVLIFIAIGLFVWHLGYDRSQADVTSSIGEEGKKTDAHEAAILALKYEMDTVLVRKILDDFEEESFHKDRDDIVVLHELSDKYGIKISLMTALLMDTWMLYP